MKDIEDINSRVVEAPTKTPEPLTTASLSLPEQTVMAENSLQQAAPAAGTATSRTATIAACSLPLPSCRRFTALRAKLAEVKAPATSFGTLRGYRAPEENKQSHPRQASLGN